MAGKAVTRENARTLKTALCQFVTSPHGRWTMEALDRETFEFRASFFHGWAECAPKPPGLWGARHSRGGELGCASTSGCILNFRNIRRSSSSSALGDGERAAAGSTHGGFASRCEAGLARSGARGVPHTGGSRGAPMGRRAGGRARGTPPPPRRPHAGRVVGGSAGLRAGAHADRGLDHADHHRQDDDGGRRVALVRQGAARDGGRRGARAVQGAARRPPARRFDSAAAPALGRRGGARLLCGCSHPHRPAGAPTVNDLLNQPASYPVPTHSAIGAPSAAPAPASNCPLHTTTSTMAQYPVGSSPGAPNSPNPPISGSEQFHPHPMRPSGALTDASPASSLTQTESVPEMTM